MKVSQSEQAYELLKRAILNCDLAPGMEISQAQLVEKFNLGITPTREALKRLEQVGYVRSIPRFGYVISELSIVDIQEIYELRLILESAAARLAATRITPGQLDQLQEAAHYTYTFRDRKSYIEFLDMNTMFHTQIAYSAGNQRLAALIKKLLDDMTRIFHLGLDLRDSAAEMRDEHLALLNALRDRDPERAEAVVRAQILRSQQRVLERLSRRVGNQPYIASIVSP